MRAAASSTGRPTPASTSAACPMRADGPGLGQARRPCRIAGLGARSTPPSVSAGALGMLAELLYRAPASVRRRRAALPALARRDALERPEAGERVTPGSCGARRADDVDAIMELERATFATDAWSEQSMRVRGRRASTRYYLVAFEPEHAGAHRRLRRAARAAGRRRGRHPDHRRRTRPPAATGSAAR